jgi:hypothetical protein
MPEADASDYEIRIWYWAEKGHECDHVLLRLIYFFPRRNLSRPQKRLHQPTLSADNQRRKSFDR